ncbi:MAG: hypothetical protein HYU66_20480 [Armatimonadetes bacterium]|nr:hypothetical protein [Armatimonadota bacterium]
MSRVEELVEEVRKLSDEDFWAFQHLLAELEADAWDRQFEADVLAGKFDALAAEALREEAEGRCFDLDDVLAGRIDPRAERASQEEAEGRCADR